MNPINIVFVLFSALLCCTLGEAYYYNVQHLDTCKVEGTISLPTEWQTMADSCTDLMMQQVKKELNASLTYLAMGAHFARDCVNRPGFSKFFFESASEERQHAIKFISYLLMRGDLTDYHQHVLTLIPSDITSGIPNHIWSSSADALQSALELEARVTESIRKIIVECEQAKDKNSEVVVNDYHLSDWLTGEFLDEQYKGQRKLAGMLSTLRKMEGVHGRLGEFLYDKTLL